MPTTTDPPREASLLRSVHRKPAVLSLYSGAGGLDLGFVDAGFEIKWAIDSDAHAVETYKANLGEHAVCGKLPDRKPPGDLRPDVIIGGPPCQGFSVIGRMDPRDPRSKHVHFFLDQVRRFRPAAFCMENVKALAVNPRWAGVRRGLERRADQLGYHVEVLVLNAAHFGVPQARERVFFIGVRDGYPVCPVGLTRDRPVTVRQALETLPPFNTEGNDTLCTAKVVPAKDPVMRPTAHKGSLLFNGSGRPLQLDAVAKTLPASMGGNATPIVDQDELTMHAEPWVVEYHRALVAGEPPAETAPDRMRRITVEEAAALQTFPLGYRWCGPLAAKYRQIGNAVPPLLSEAVARSVLHALAARAAWIEDADDAVNAQRIAA